MTELWRMCPMPGAENYEVSTLGRVRNATTKYVLTPFRTGRKGRQTDTVRVSTKPRIDYSVAHMVLETFVGPRPDEHEAMHRDDDRTNNRLDNIRWGTRSENHTDRAQKVRGGNQKLNAEQMREIKRRRDAGEQGRALAIEFGVSEQTVCDLYKGRTRKALTKPVWV